MTVRVLATLTTKPGMGDELLTLWPAIAEQVRAEELNLAYDLWRDSAAPDVFVVWELWESMEGLKAHGQMPHMRDYAAARAHLMAGPSVVQILDPIG